MNAVILTISGRNYQGWTSVRITRGLHRAASDFQLNVTERYPDEPQPIRIRPGDACTINIGPDRVLTGYVDSVQIGYDKASHTISVSGRSKTADLIDCAVQPPWNDFNNQTLIQIANKISEPYGVDILDAIGGETEPIPKEAIDSGETVFQVIDRLAKIKGVLVTDDPLGRLFLTRAGTARASTGLTLGENILSCNGTFDHKARFHTYRVVGQDKGSDGATAKNISEIEAVIIDEGAREGRVKVIEVSGLASLDRAKDRGRWEAAAAIAKSMNATYSVQGWRQKNGDLWAVNTLVPVDDAVNAINGDLLISEVTYSLSAAGSITTMQVAPRAAFELRPMPKDEKPGADLGMWKGLEQGVQEVP